MCLCLCEHMLHVCRRCLGKPEEHVTPWSWSSGGLRAFFVECWEPNFSLLEEQKVFLISYLLRQLSFLQKVLLLSLVFGIMERNVQKGRGSCSWFEKEKIVILPHEYVTYLINIHNNFFKIHNA